MTQIYLDGKAVPATIVEIPENVVCSIIPSDNGQSMVEIGMGIKKRADKATKGKYQSLKNTPAHTWTFWTADKEIVSGTLFGPEVVADGETAVVTGISKGKGFAGVVKRWGFHGGPKTHGQSDRQRTAGAIGPGTDPGRIWKGTKMAGKMGGNRYTLSDRKVIGVGDGYILIQGALPGNSGSLLLVTVKKHEN